VQFPCGYAWGGCEEMVGGGCSSGGVMVRGLGGDRLARVWRLLHVVVCSLGVTTATLSSLRRDWE
jgi:hypothetical protein